MLERATVPAMQDGEWEAMREPVCGMASTNEEWPYSKAPVWALQMIVRNLGYHQESEENKHLDVDFRRRYAAILLKERGL